MNSDYDDDDVVEDYDEVDHADDDTGSAPPRRSGSEGGGPVRRPSRPVRPTDSVKPPQDYDDESEFDPNKGKISLNSAKIIWIVCIAITVLGIGAVVADIVLNPRETDSQGADNRGARKPGANKRKRRPQKKLTQHEMRAKTFIGMVAGKKNSMTNSRAWDYFMTAYWQFDYDKWFYLNQKQNNVTGDALKAAAMAVIDSYMQVSYAAELFVTFNHGGEVIGFDPIDTDIWELVLELRDEFLDNHDAQQWQAAINKVSSRLTVAKKFRTDVIKNDLFVNKLWLTDEVVAMYRELNNKIDGLYDDPKVIDADDAKFVSGKDYKSDERMKWEVLREELDKKRKGD